ncbi:MAG: hypothetical protein N4A57_04675 [Anaeromicrobium sp.]|jgi:hypothetical protein|uniref:hypothetical protein n=1 Tax=Anaeromicrobium sp. TaxID=1929132 RepID=UPI0025D5DD1A|nr:hypothetical protein [Anaeromicrobium sp.]MCT4593552.1 hypothetical protein [Anaeromicrobium sp.]
MSNELTRVIMKNIVNRCSNSKRGDMNKIHIGNKEENIIRNIIHKGNRMSVNVETNRKLKGREEAKSITLDELINKSVGNNSSSQVLVKKETKDSSIRGINKVSLEDIVPKVSLTSIGKKR